MRKAEPELEGVEENPVYRAMVFGSRSRRTWWRLPSAIRGVALGLTIVLVFVLSSLLIPFLILLLVLSRQRSHEPEAFFHIPRALMADLLQAPVGHRDWTVAVWAQGVRGGGGPAAPAAALTVAAACYGLSILMYRLMGTESADTRSLLFGLGGAIAGCLPFFAIRSATTPLPALVKRLRVFRMELSRRRNPLSRMGAVLLQTMAGLFTVFLCVAGLGLLISNVAGLESGRLLPAGIAHHPATPYGFFLGGFALAAGIGAGWRRFVRRNREGYLRQMDAEMEKILERLRFPDGSSHPIFPGRRAVSRPAGGRPPAALTTTAPGSR